MIKKDKLFLAIIISLALLAGWAVIRSLRVSNSYARVSGEYKQAKKDMADREIKYAAERAAIIADKDSEIAKRDAENSQLEKSIDIKDSKLASLESEYAELQDLPAKLLNLQQQLEEWKQKFSLAQSEIANLKKNIFDLTADYESKLKRLDLSWQTQYEDYKKSVNSKCEESLSVLRRDLFVAKLGSNIKTILIVAASAFILIETIRGDLKWERISIFCF